MHFEAVTTVFWVVLELILFISSCSETSHLEEIWRALSGLSESIFHSCKVLVKQIKLPQQYVTNFM